MKVCHTNHRDPVFLDAVYKLPIIADSVVAFRSSSRGIYSSLKLKKYIQILITHPV